MSARLLQFLHCGSTHLPGKRGSFDGRVAGDCMRNSSSAKMQPVLHTSMAWLYCPWHRMISGARYLVEALSDKEKRRGLTGKNALRG